MTNSYTGDDLIALAKFPFNDPDWQNKFLIGSLLTLAGYIIPIIPLIFVYGYAFQIMQRIIVEKGSPYLPDWDDWGRLFSDGLKLTGVSLIYSLPIMVLFCGGLGVHFASIIGMVAIPQEASADSPAVILPFVGMGVFFITFGLSMVLALIWGAILPAAIGHMIATNDFAAAFRVREWWAIFKANLGGYLIAYALLLGAWVVLSFAMQILYVTLILCCLVPFIMVGVSMYLIMIGSALFGQAYRAGAEMVASRTIVI
jgi:hypothetical protein